MLPSISSTQFLLFYLILLFVPSRTVAYRWQICSTSDGHFTDNSTYEANLNLLLSSLVSNGSGSGFSTGTVGRVPNQVQGLVLCRGDTNATTCGSCLSNGAVEIRQICAYDRDAVVWYDECLLRFSNLQFLSTSDNDPTAALENVNQVNDDPDRFNKVVTELLDSTADWAAYNSTKRYATGQAFNVTPAFPTIYALAQCTPDMSASDCRNCLEGVSQGLPMARMGARNQGVRCNLRYESSLFFQGNPIIRLISPVTNATTPAENATTPASAPTSHPAVGPIGKEDQTDSEQATQVIESLLFRLATLRVATVNFAEANKLGEDAVRGKQLTWGIRYKIICGIARGLLYLHEESQLKIIHRDLKASNILLDADMNPKISDFGLAKLFDIDQTQGTTNRVMGTFGYMAPEYVMRGKFSIKSDVFSFGVLEEKAMVPIIQKLPNSTPSLLFYLITLLLLSSPAVATQVCSTSAGKFTTNSTYESNLNLLLSSLISNGSASGFFTDTVGRMPNQVHGLVLCRGDTNATTCSSCLVTAGVEILQLCAYDKDAVVWYDDCHLRYSNLQFLSTLDNDPEMAVASEYQVYDETDRFNKVVNELMNRTADWAAYNSTKRYATGLAINATHAFPNIYGLAQCTPDMSATDCRQCLEGASQGKKKTIVAISISAVSAVLLIPIIYICYRRLRKQTSKSPYGSESEQAAQAESLLFQISALRIATANFSEENKLGEGGFGAVYKGVLPDGREIAVKRLLNSGHGLGELKNELVLVAKLRHRNLVKLLGVCLEEEKMIVYEYDIKASNILLDADMNPKITDFGFAKLFDVDQTQAITNRVVGTFGYMAPEYVMHGKYSIKSDVFGFGVLVLEILTGRKSSGSYNPEVIEVLLSYFLLLYLILLFAPSPTVAFTWQVCSTSAGNFTANSTYESNVNLLLSSLVSNGSAPGFFTDTVGRIPNQVQGLVLCRGDTNATTCSPCLSKGAVEILQLCAYDKDAVVWYDECLLRFSNLQFLSTSDNDPTVALENEIAVNDEADRFNKVVNELLDSTADWAAYNSTKRYATGLAFNVTLAFPTIYALAQCTPDMSASDCRQCLEGVSQGLPMARMGARNQGVRCNLRYESSPFFHGNPIIRLISPATNATTPAENATTPASAPAFRPSVGSTSKEGKKKTILAISISAVSAVLLLSIIYACSMRLRKQILKPPYATDSEQATQVESLLFDLSTLRVATVNFSEENKLGEGGFGAVYKGVLPDGRVIAVKRLLNSGQGLGELKNELALVAKLQHRNLVKLLGVCLEEEKMIVYEYVPNTSLDKFLFDPVRGEQLTWGIRYKIICGIARGLLYLHEESQLKIIHRDLKACNILLDADMNPKISDFGSAKLFDGEQTQGMTSRVVGTYGYMAPEYVIHGQFSIKSDVFSFGVLVLEILTGRKNSTTCNPENTEDLLSYTWEKWRGGLALEMVDPALGNQFHGSDLLRCIQIGLLCVQENPFSRPTMSTITVMLNKPCISRRHRNIIGTQAGGMTGDQNCPHLQTVLLLSMRNPGAEGDGVVIEELLSMRTTDAVVKGNGMDTNRSSSIIHPCVGVSKEAVISPSGRIFCGGAATAEGVNGGGEASLAFVLRHVELAKRLAEDLVWGTPCRSVREAGGDGGRGEGREEEVEVGMVGAVGGKVGVCWTTFP
ncbi:Cysteine-rich receptor-like protein kinase [Musa troglodytarum]|uniref:Cysteine-rich receptor-like protein kinase n=1 Tax=Musa troglodytarum TaxID=320322 RepID=A0A9E7HCT7_9LILI|nr:Cysteine-rich receptor-like protein kinase [Musa troglodytarum]